MMSAASIPSRARRETLRVFHPGLGFLKSRGRPPRLVRAARTTAMRSADAPLLALAVPPLLIPFALLALAVPPLLTLRAVALLRRVAALALRFVSEVDSSGRGVGGVDESRPGYRVSHSVTTHHQCNTASGADLRSGFRGMSYGFRPGRNAHQALDALASAARSRRECRESFALVDGTVHTVSLEKGGAITSIGLGHPGEMHAVGRVVLHKKLGVLLVVLHLDGQAQRAVPFVVFV